MLALNNVHHGDCLDLLKLVESKTVDAIVTDPPFAFSDGSTRCDVHGIDATFYTCWLVDLFKHFYRVSKEEAIWFLWGDWKAFPCYSEALNKAKPDYWQRRWISHVFIHDRLSAGVGWPIRSSVECIALVKGRVTKLSSTIKSPVNNIIYSKWPHRRRHGHPASKSVEVAKKLISWACPPGGVLLDPFVGSGSVIVAAHELGRTFLGIEKESEFCELARDRVYANS